MQTIFKYPIQCIRHQIIQLPAYAEILDAGSQNDQLFLWARVYTENKPERHSILVFGTGERVDFTIKKHIKTVHQGAFVWHIFEGCL